MAFRALVFSAAADRAFGGRKKLDKLQVRRATGKVQLAKQDPDTLPGANETTHSANPMRRKAVGSWLVLGTAVGLLILFLSWFLEVGR